MAAITREIFISLNEAPASIRTKVLREFDRLDKQIAATALTHGLTVATRNVKHFESSGVTMINPFS